MPNTFWDGPWPPMAITDGPAVTAAALTDASPIPQRVVPVSSFVPGTRVWLHAQGEYSTSSATPTLQLGFYFGTPGSIATATPIAVTTPLVIPSAAAAFSWFLDWFGEVRAPGASGQLRGQGYCTFANTVTTGLTSDMPQFPMPVTAAGRTVSVNLAAAQYLMVGCTWSSTTGTPSLTCSHVEGAS